MRERFFHIPIALKRTLKIKKLVGITYDLKDDYLAQGFDAEKVAEFDNIQTINAIDESLKALGFNTVRIGNIKHLVQYLAQGKVCDFVFNIAEGMYGLAREAQIPALLEAYSIPHVFSDALVLAVSLHKGMSKAVVAKNGVPTPEYMVINGEKDIENLTIPYPLFLKPVGGGTGMGISASSIVRDKTSLTKEANRLLKSFEQPVLAEAFLEGREFTVGITGCGEDAECLAVMEILVDSASDEGIYSYKTKQEYLEYAKYSLVDGDLAKECEKVALGAWRALGCLDGGRVDLKADNKGQICFLEVNPLAGLNPVDSDLPILCKLNGISYQELIEKIVRSAMSRISGTKD
jgi:D-alanine-D-alanine ligase